MTDPHPFSSGFLTPPSPARPDLDLFDDANLQKIYQEMVDEGETRPLVVEYCYCVFDVRDLNKFSGACRTAPLGSSLGPSVSRGSRAPVRRRLDFEHAHGVYFRGGRRVLGDVTNGPAAAPAADSPSFVPATPTSSVGSSSHSDSVVGGHPGGHERVHIGHLQRDQPTDRESPAGTVQAAARAALCDAVPPVSEPLAIAGTHASLPSATATTSCRAPWRMRKQRQPRQWRRLLSASRRHSSL